MSSASSTMPVTSSDQISTSKIWGVILASSVGTMIEWYDFYIFGTLAVYLAPKFYPPGNQLFQYIAYLATFAVGFMVRPFGALFFGRIGDLVGRKYAFIVTLTIMGGATALVGALPSYAQAGWFSPIILIGLRVLQGLALGGEYGGAAEAMPELLICVKMGDSFICSRMYKEISTRINEARNGIRQPQSLNACSLIWLCVPRITAMETNRPRVAVIWIKLV
jgi:hypothetical protein